MNPPVRIPALPLLLLLCLSAGPVRGQEAHPELRPGRWAGHLVPMRHPELRSRIALVVAGSGADTSIRIRGPGGGEIEAGAVVAAVGAVRFTFREPEADVPLTCDLTVQEAGELRGRCTDPDGRWAELILAPPGP